MICLQYLFNNVRLRFYFIILSCNMTSIMFKYVFIPYNKQRGSTFILFRCKFLHLRWIKVHQGLKCSRYPLLVLWLCGLLSCSTEFCNCRKPITISNIFSHYFLKIYDFQLTLKLYCHNLIFVRSGYIYLLSFLSGFWALHLILIINLKDFCKTLT
jgi:hypothetical protein